MMELGLTRLCSQVRQSQRRSQVDAVTNSAYTMVQWLSALSHPAIISL